MPGFPVIEIIFSQSLLPSEDSDGEIPTLEFDCISACKSTSFWSPHRNLDEPKHPNPAAEEQIDTD